MTHAELRQAAIDYLGRVFNGDKTTTPTLAGVAASIVLTPEPKA